MNYDTKLPTLGRDVQVGNLYNYFTDEIETAGRWYDFEQNQFFCLSGMRS